MKWIVGFCLCAWLIAAHADSGDWDTLMDSAASALKENDLVVARKFSSQAVRQGQYIDADHYISSLVLHSQIQQESGDLLSAEDSIRKAIETIGKVPGPIQRDKSILHNNLGVLLDLGGDIKGAEQQYMAALNLQIDATASSPDDRFSLQLNLAGVWERLGNIQKARAFFLDAEAELPNLGANAHILFNNNYGTFLQNQGLKIEAIQRFSAAIKTIGADNAERLARGALLHNLGTTELDLGDVDAAEAHLKEAERIRGTLLGDAHIDVAKTRTGLAALYEIRGMFDVALSYSRGATAAILARLKSVGVKRASAASALDRIEWRESLGTHLRLLALTQSDPAEGSDEALSIIQVIKNGEVARFFSNANIGIDGDSGNRIRAIRLQLDKFRIKEKELMQELQATQSNARREGKLRSELASERQTLERLQTELQQLFPRYYELMSGSVSTLKAIQASLKVDQGAIVYLSVKKQTFIVAVTKESSIFVISDLAEADLNHLVKRIRLSVDPEHLGARFAFEESSKIYRALVKPVEPLLRGKSSWYIVPDGALESLPFSLLLTEPISKERQEKFIEVPWLLRQHATAVLPSLAAISTIVESKTDSTRQPLLAFADPSIGLSATGNLRTRNPNASGAWNAKNSSDGKKLANPDWLRRLVSLPETAGEAEAIRATLGGGDVFLRQAATEAKLKSLDLTRYRNILFATHGAMANELADFGEPGLVLSPPSKATELDDGILSASEIAQLRLNADLVVLSACNTAATDGAPGAEGMSGLAKSFFYAGAKNLLVSHWSVESEATVKITTVMFQRIMESPSSDKAKALQNSMMNLASGKVGEIFKHPMYWAPFVLVGIAQ